MAFRSIAFGFALVVPAVALVTAVSPGTAAADECIAGMTMESGQCVPSAGGPVNDSPVDNSPGNNSEAPPRDSVPSLAEQQACQNGDPSEEQLASSQVDSEQATVSFCP
jgi:hypothetical protein